MRSDFACVFEILSKILDKRGRKTSFIMGKIKKSLIRICLFVFLSNLLSGKRPKKERIPHCTHKSTQIALLLFGNYAIISFGDKQVCAADEQSKTIVRRTKTCTHTQLIGCETQTRGEIMKQTTEYFVVKQKALPEVLLKVVEAKRLIDSGRNISVQEAVDRVGISRSSFYKYKEDIFPFHDTATGTTITLTFQMDDEPGLLSDVLKTIATFGANILTIHQSIPINGVASLSISVQVLPTTGDVSKMVDAMEQQKGVHYVKIIAKE